MDRRAFCLTIRPGMEEEYDRRHREVWPELLKLLKECGVRNYTIFRSGSNLFGYMEKDECSIEAFSLINAHPVQQRWYDYMSDVLVRDEDNCMRLLNEVFHLE